MYYFIVTENLILCPLYNIFQAICDLLSYKYLIYPLHDIFWYFIIFYIYFLFFLWRITVTDGKDFFSFRFEQDRVGQ